MEKCFLPADILLPNVQDKTAWACIACDQFTSEVEYWQQLKDFVGDKESTLNFILPEVYLDSDADKRIAQINANIKEGLLSNIFYSEGEGFILTVRSTPFVKRRIGIIGKIDLESYEYSKKSNALIRSTEGTIEERIPPRLKIRKDADVEFPHVMILFDDEKREIAENLYKERSRFKKVYDFDLNMGGGHIEGYFIPKTERLEERFLNLLNAQRQIEKYGKDDGFLFAVGDGNHSLATAKAHWNNLKNTLTQEELKDHPARYALAEVVNIYDEGIYFRPIHRLIKGVDKKAFINGLKGVKGDFTIYDGKETCFKAGCSLPQSITAIDGYIKDYISANGGEIDYVHGEDNIRKLVDGKEDAVGVLFDKLDKKDLFKFVSENGSLPRKTFSMGEGVEKRYYLEGRRITKC